MFSRAAKSVVKSLGQCSYHVGEENIKVIGEARGIGKSLSQFLKQSSKLESVAINDLLSVGKSTPQELGLQTMPQLTKTRFRFNSDIKSADVNKNSAEEKKISILEAANEQSDTLDDVFKKLPISEESKITNNFQIMNYKLQGSRDCVSNICASSLIHGEMSSTRFSYKKKNIAKDLKNFKKLKEVCKIRKSLRHYGYDIFRVSANSVQKYTFNSFESDKLLSFIKKETIISKTSQNQFFRLISTSAKFCCKNSYIQKIEEYCRKLKGRFGSDSNKSSESSCRKKRNNSCKSKVENSCNEKSEDHCKKKVEDPCKKKVEDPCKKKVEDPCKKTVEDPCKKKVKDPCKNKVEDPCTKKVEDPCKKKVKDPCKKKSDDPCKKKVEDPCKKKVEDPCKKKVEDPCKKKVEDPCKKTVEDPCKKKVGDPCKKKVEDPCKKKVEDPCKKKVEDLCKKKVEDPCKKKVEDPCKKKVEDPCKNKVEDPCTKKVEDPCKKKVEDPCKKKLEGPCKKKVEDPCKKKVEDPCKKNVEDLRKKKIEDSCKETKCPPVFKVPDCLPKGDNPKKSS